MAELPTTTVRTETNGPLVTGIAVGFVSAAVFFVAGRLYTRGVLIRSIGKDDWSMLIATVCSPFLYCHIRLLTALLLSGTLGRELNSHVL